MFKKLGFCIFVLMARRGRNIDKITARNRRLAARLYFYEELCGLRSEVFLPYLAEEFDLSQSRIEDLLPIAYRTADVMRKQAVGISKLCAYYPFMSWKYVHSKRLQRSNLPPLVHV